ncbi:copper-binding transcription factor [Toensbergia leucococca]|nr:copper-binding transcription factor [Toensbergia leucococca]
MAELLGVVDRSLSGLENFSTESQETLRAEDLPVPRFMLDAHVAEPDVMDVDQSSDRVPHFRSTQKHHTSDSGIGSTITGSEESLFLKDYRTHNMGGDHATVASTIEEGRIQSGINGITAPSAGPVTGTQHALSEYACRQIQKHIILPIVRESTLKEFHPLVSGIPYRVNRKEITCLRDLEKVLLWLAPVSDSGHVRGRSLAHFMVSGAKKWSVSKASFINFCETSIQCLHTTVEHLNEQDQRRPTDRPYTNGYFLDLVEQVRQYAAMLAASRERMASGKAPSGADCTDDEQLKLEGGLSQTGRAAELVRIKNGQPISLRTGTIIKGEGSSAGQSPIIRAPTSEELDDNIIRSMARRRKSAQPTIKDAQSCSECDKVFKRPCDLTKHEKTHSRPWKCTELKCKYHDYGWPTEKERDRHVNDKHSVTPSMYKCRYHPCPYESKRESNCKQHMEKAHGWAYVRSKNNRKNGKQPQDSRTSPTSQMTTPESFTLDAPTSEYGEASSWKTHDTYSISHSVNGMGTPSEGSTPHSNLEEPLMALDDTFNPFDPSFSWNDSYSGFNGAVPNNNGSHIPSWDSASLTTAPTVPSSFESTLTPHDQDPLFSENFDWSNMDTTNFTSYNVQLITPANSVETRPLDAFSRNPSISVEQPPRGHLPSLSPGAQANLMLYSPYSNHDVSADEGFGDFASDTGKPTNDFALFDGSNAASSMSSMTHQSMFQDLSHFPTAWSGRGTELAQQLGMNDLMQVDEE